MVLGFHPHGILVAGAFTNSSARRRQGLANSSLVEKQPSHAASLVQSPPSSETMLCLQVS